MRYYLRKQHVATFRGKHNEAKTKALIILYHRKNRLCINTGLIAREIHLHSGVNYDYLLARLGKWREWHYVTRYVGTDDSGRPVFRYRIGVRGELFINQRVPGEILERYIQEINAFRRSFSRK